MKRIGLCCGVVALVVAITIGCEKSDDVTGPSGDGTSEPTPAGTPDSLVFDPQVGALLANGVDAVTVYATVVDGRGRGLADVGVRFAVTAGTIDPFATTGSQGVASATVTSQASVDDLIATVTAEATADSGAALATAAVALSAVRLDAPAMERLVARQEEAPGSLVQASDVPRLLTATLEVAMTGVTLDVTASPSVLPADGLTPGVVVAQLRETTRRVPLAGESIVFGSSGGTITGNALTDAAGAAQAMLTGSPGDSAAVVTAYYGAGLTSQITVAFQPLILTLVASASTLTANGTDQTAMTAYLRTVEGNPVPGAAVRFTTSLGSVASPVTTDAEGRAGAQLVASEEPGTAQVIARFAEALAETIQVEFLAPASTATLLLQVTPEQLPADGQSEALLRATALDAMGGLMADGTPVAFALQAGDGLILVPQATTVDGEATAVYVAGTEIGPVIVRATSGEAEASAVLEQTVGTAVGALTLASDMTELLADGIALAELTVVATDPYGHPIRAGTQPQWTTSAGLLEGLTPTDATGTARALLRAEPLVTGLARVTVALGGQQTTCDVALVSEEAAHIRVAQVDPPQLGVWGGGDDETSRLLFIVEDRHGIPVDADHGEVLEFTVAPLGAETDATVHPASAATNARGEVAATLNAGTTSGAVEIHATSGALEAEPIRIAIHGGQPDPEHFSIAFAKVNIAGLVYAGLQNPATAYVGDLHGNPVPVGTRVWFSTTHGLIEGSAGTDSLGQAQVTEVTAGPYPLIPGGDGLVGITAQTVGAQGEWITTSGQVLWSGPTIVEILSPAPGFAVPNDSLVTISYAVRDANENPLTEGTQIGVSADGGRLSGTVDVTLPDTQSPAYTMFTAILADDEPETVQARPVTLTVRVTSQNGDAEVSVTGTVY